MSDVEIPTFTITFGFATIALGFGTYAGRLRVLNQRLRREIAMKEYEMVMARQMV